MRKASKLTIKQNLARLKAVWLERAVHRYNCLPDFIRAEYPDDYKLIYPSSLPAIKKIKEKRAKMSISFPGDFHDDFCDLAISELVDPDSAEAVDNNNDKKKEK